MNFLSDHILSVIIFLPLAGAIAVLLVSPEKKELIRQIGFGILAFDFVLAVPMFISFSGKFSMMQFVESASWIPQFGISYSVGVDGISILLFMLTVFLGPIVILSAWNAIQERVKEFIAFLLLLQTGMLGVFAALDFFLFYMFWELVLIPMYFIIGVWGGEQRIYATIKFFIYTMFGSVLMLVAILYLAYTNYHATGEFTMNIEAIMRNQLPVSVQMWLFAAFALAFAIKVPLFPFHTWLPDAHVEAPTAGSVILAGILLKMGTYGFIRFCLPLFPKATFIFMPYIAVLAVIGIIYGALVSLVQPDMKKLVAYSSVSHLGFVMLGLFALTMQSIQGGVLQMINHGLSTGALFLLVGMIYERTHTRMIADYGGLAKKMPIYATFLMIVVLSSLGLPGTNGFIGEFLILLGSFQSPYISWVFTVFAALGVILAAVYLLRWYQRFMFGNLKNEKLVSVGDINLREIAVLVPIVVFILWIGLYPKTFLDKTEASVKMLIRHIETGEIIRWTDSEKPAGKAIINITRLNKE
jgi:NADH-quinone oxidoreductase subunit M